MSGTDLASLQDARSSDLETALRGAGRAEPTHPASSLTPGAAAMAVAANG